ncbi:MAG TPA: radical SAM protein [Polyangia bacterium]
MKILLVNPRFPPSLWDFSGCMELEGSAYPHPPLALPTLAALTPHCHEVRLVDENVEPIDLAADADLVGITGYYIQRGRILELADAFRARGIPVAIGGPIVEHSTVAMLAPHADALFRGEAEHTWPRYLDELARGCATALYDQPALIDMRESPPPRYELLRRGAYSTATIETSRGCPMACEFCEIPTRLGQKARSKSIEQVMTEVRAWHALGADSIFFIDDHFIGNRAHCKRLLEELARFVVEIEHAMYFTCQFTINLARDQEMLELLHAANFRRVFVGIETPRKETLLAAKKKQNVVGDLVESVHTLQSYNLTVWAGMIVGFDGDDAAIFDEQQAFLAEAGIPVIMNGLLQAIPGTPLHARMARDGRLRDVAMAGVRGNQEALITSNIVRRPSAHELDDAQLVRGYQRMMRDVYEPERFADRLLGSLRRGARPVARSRRPPTWKQLAIVARLARHYLLTTDRRRQKMFVRIVGETLRHRPDELDTALMHLVVYKHLRAFYARIAELPLPVAAPLNIDRMKATSVTMNLA